MKKPTSKTAVAEQDDILPEYDFSKMAGGVRGKYYKDLSQGYTIRIHKSDGRIVERHVKPKDRAVVLAPDVRKYFPDSDSVNQALRALIALIPNKRKAATKSR